MTNKKYRTKKLLLLVFPFSFLLVLVLVLLLLLLFSHLLPISLSLSLSLTYLSASHKAATKASDIANNHGAVLLGRRPPAQPARAQQTLLVMAPRRSIPLEANTSGGVPSEFFAGLERASLARNNALIYSVSTPPDLNRQGKGDPPPRYGPP